MPTTLLRVDRAEATDLARRVRNFLHAQPHPELQALQVEVRHDVVTVRGRVPSPYAQQLASDYCQRVAGVRRVVNETTVSNK
jgi:osmotically-inducible protein OsmY